MTRAEATNSKVKQSRDTIVTNTIASSLAEETRGPLTVDSDRTCSDRRSRKNKHSNGIPKSIGRVCASARPICHGGKLWE